MITLLLWMHREMDAGYCEYSRVFTSKFRRVRRNIYIDSRFSTGVQQISAIVDWQICDHYVNEILPEITVMVAISSPLASVKMLSSAAAPTRFELRQASSPDLESLMCDLWRFTKEDQRNKV